MNQKSNLIFGTLLILFGVLSLAVNLNLIYLDFEYVLAFMLLAAAAYLFVRFRKTQQFGSLIAAAILLFIGSAILIEHAWFVDDELTGVLLFWIMTALFIFGYVRDQRKWGLLIPAGVLFTLGSIVLIDMSPFMDDDLMGSVFFLGLGLTFGFLYLIRNEQNKLDWARIPALILTVFAGFIFLMSTDLFYANLIFPLILIAIGGYLIYHSTQNRAMKRSA
ncbi:hypothetical protein GWO43_30375 [candidate division KSB1 bacterium]|nr:hypothetical protein [candidate division KSB1 bacterium]NIR68628.1 hypothetical protein [candidate division KSB1 bacterium]NIS28198.1 hypothetical protein [candidate division KSB1 bacterium]NIT75089.1 hypothetical protein [candidate division KSB1 bacterium]NIU28874.1 hypothetical protein [candidate division KSB1 bacterium]